MRVVRYSQPQGLNPNPLQILSTFLKPLNFVSLSSTIFSAQHILDKPPRSSERSQRVQCRQSPAAWGRNGNGYTAEASAREREAGLGMLCVLESVHRHMGPMGNYNYDVCGLNCLGIFQVI